MSTTNAVRLFYWHDRPNFGDAISLDIVKWASDRDVKVVAGTEHRKLLAVGSILQYARDGDIVWGAGIHPGSYDAYGRNIRKWYQLPRRTRKAVEVCAVRGPLSRDVLLNRDIPCPEIFGDPAILAPQLYTGERNPIKRVGLISHFNDLATFKGYEELLINVEAPWRCVVDAILQCEFVVSSSLHGLIVAEAYGVPAVWLRVLNSEGFIKYADYYLGTGRTPRPVYRLSDALRGPVEPAPSLENARRKLLEAFPRSLESVSS